MDQNNSIEVRQKIKELYKRPGGLFAKITGILVLLAIGYGIYMAFPFLVAAASNLLILILEFIGITALISLITNKDFRRGLQLVWLQLIRKMYGTVVNIDPIAILQNGINEMRKKLNTVKESITKLESLNVNMEKKLKQYKEDFERYIAEKKRIEKTTVYHDDMERMRAEASLRLANNNISRMKKQIEAQTERIVIAEKYLKVMKKLEIAAKFKVDDAQNELNFRKEEYEAAKEQTKAIKSVTAIFDGGLSKTLEEELAMTNVTDTINMSIAEMNRMLDGSNEILANFELDQDINAAKADKILEMFDQNGFEIFNRETKQESSYFSHSLHGVQDAAYQDVTPVAEKQAVPAHGSYFN